VFDRRTPAWVITGRQANSIDFVSPPVFYWHLPKLVSIFRRSHVKHVRRNRGRTNRRPGRTIPVITFIAAVAIGSAVSLSSQGAAAVAATPAVATQQDGRPAPAQKRFRATRPIAIDQATGRGRMPTDAEVEQLVETLSTLTKRTSDDLQETTVASGATAIDLGGGFAGVMLARASEDGTLETLCVFTFEEGAEFLGLVEIQ
jgi:hypothetical protein